VTSRAFLAPGRVNLIGEHTDYSGGLVLPAAIELGIRLESEPAERIVLRSDAGSPIDLAADGSEPGEGWGRYVAAVAAELAALGRPPVGLSGTVTSDLPQGAGLSSSAALEVVVGLALCAVASFVLDALALAQAAQRAELRAVGVPCGIMDQAVSLLGVAGHAVLLDTATLRHEAVPLPNRHVLLVVDSGVSHALEGGEYAQRRAELERATGGADVGGLDVEDAERLIAGSGVDDVAARRLLHVAGENARVRRVVDAFRADPPDLAAVGLLFRQGHDSLRDLFEISTPELDLLVDLAYEHGAVAARMTGGGFGGSIVALVPSERADEIASAIRADYRERTSIDPHAFTTHAAEGAREL
jgi:galactokinase